MTCRHSSDCPLYEKFALQSTLQIWKLHYWDTKYETCFRYKLSALGKRVPATMLPNGKDIADRSEK